MRKIWKPIVAVLMGLVFSNVVLFVVHVLVLQIYPCAMTLGARNRLSKSSPRVPMQRSL